MFYVCLVSLLLTAPLAAHSSTDDNEHHHHHHHHKEVSIDQLKAWYDQKKPMVVLDARSKQYFDGNLLPQAKWLPSDTEEKDITAAIPAKDSLVVVYCAGVGCPASGWLYDKLVGMGYTNVYEFEDGINGWVKNGFPVDKSNKT